MGFYSWQGEDLVLQVYVQPRASRDAVIGLHGDSLKMQITAPPVEGRANAHLQTFLATLCGVPKSQVSLLSGDSGRHKRLRIRAPIKLPPGVEPPGTAFALKP